MLPDFVRSLFLEGPAGSGKTTTAARYLVDLINQRSVPPDQILVLTAHPVLAAPYQKAVSGLSMRGAPEITTLSGLARLAIFPFWSALVEQQGFNPARTQPRFLSADLAQYHLHRFVQPYWEMGIFNAVRLPRHRVVTQILDSINHAALASLSFSEVASRLTVAWGERHSSRRTLYETTMAVARQYHDFCREYGLLDFALQVSVLVNTLLDDLSFQSAFREQFRYCVVDNVEEMGALAHDFIFWCMENVEKTVVVYDRDGGYRSFLGADPTNAYLLLDVCDQHVIMDQPVALSPALRQLVMAAQTPIETDTPPTLSAVPPGVVVSTSTFYPQMIDDCVQQVQRLVTSEHVPPNQIALITPYLNDALLFALQSRLQELAITCVYYRPSRPLQTEAPAQMLITLMQLAAASAEAPMPLAVMQALTSAIVALDPVRGALLTQAVYRPTGSPRLEAAPPALQSRLPTTAIESYNQLQQWLTEHAVEAQVNPAQFLSALVSDVLSQPGFVYADVNEIPPVVTDTLNTADRFQEMHVTTQDSDTPVPVDFLHFLEYGFTLVERELSQQDAVLIIPAHTFLTRDMTVDYQFWLDAGDSGWYERIQQPLTHPFVLRRGFPEGTVWTDEMELTIQDDNLHRMMLGLLRRCRKGLFIEACDISATGYEQRGQLLLALQQLFAEAV